MTIEVLQEQLQMLEGLLKSNQSIHSIYQIKSQFLGKSSAITQLLQTIPTLPQSERQAFGGQINNYRKTFENAIAAKIIECNSELINQKLKAEYIDYTLPYDNGMKTGQQHILSKTIDELLDIMLYLGFNEVCGPEIEDEFHNFTALNVPPLHPARQSQDTFYLNDIDMLLRTQTSSVQIRHMMSNKPPHYIVSIGKAYRVDNIDQTHLPMFHQIELLCIDKEITLLNMKQIIQQILKMFFMIDDAPMRFRASYFPFTSPSMEVDVQFNNKWLELGGCGMVHPEVLKNVSLTNDWQGFACGFGVERMAMIKHNIKDIRGFIENDIRWLKHYGVA